MPSGVQYMEMSFVARESTWISSSIRKITGDLIPCLMLDNTSAVKIATNCSRKNSRRVQKKFHLINEMIVKQQLTLQWTIQKNRRQTDIFMKKLAKVKAQRFCKGNWNKGVAEGSVMENAIRF
ncbi:hypothetical protein O181_006714 [Austropuccinia psidii MF-1]|uniref:Uncharacterized protein n=1 Tax=Austropuccinia psidii MF-1 TaxID=1389203 RepID=A0A9Q3BKK1_9BASI|nr:hypothetical protein [Austropuccinia psidii MF-1]